MKYSSDFNYDLEFGEKAEDFVNKLFTNGGKIEVKYDRKAHETGNLFVEVFSRDKPSGISTTKANYWIFVIDKSQYAIILNIEKLKKLCRLKYKEGGYVLGGDENTSKGILIPINLITGQKYSVNKNRKDYSDKIGDDTQNLFVKSCENVGYVCEKTKEEVDIKEHIDYYIARKDNTKTSVDVKGGNHPKVIWVEFNNVNGEKGWIYGKAEHIAFDMPELSAFVIVDRVELSELCEVIVEKVFVTKQEATRKLYQRKGRRDVISRLELTDLMKLKSYKLLKYAK